jgi:hypothetical protein
MPKRSTGKSAAPGPRRSPPGGGRGAPPAPKWTFLSNHAHVLICLAQDPEIRLRDVSDRIGITERAVLKIVADLEVQGLLQRHRQGRRNAYELKLEHPLRHPIESHRTIGELIELMGSQEES